MKGKIVDYTRILTDEDKVRFYFVKKRGKIVKFIIQYFGLFNGKWRSILRIDNCHGFSHQHTYHLLKKELVVQLGKSSNEIFTEVSRLILKDFKKIKENFIFTK